MAPRKLTGGISLKAIPPMRVAHCPRYGPPEIVQILERPAPVPRPGQIVVRVVATTVNSGDARMRALAMPAGMKAFGRLALGWNGPRASVLGSECCGEVVAVGARVSRWRPGDRVVAFAGVRLGCHAEMVALPDNGRVVAWPAGLDHHAAAALFFGSTTALHFLRVGGGLAPGARVLVVGASGAVGSAAVQLARHFGATVTGVTSAANAALVKDLGAHAVVDYEREDFTAGGGEWDVILDTVGVIPWARARRVLAPRGRFLMVAVGLGEMIGALATLPRRQRAIAGVAPERAEDVALLAELAAAGAWRPVIDSVVPFDRIAEAHARVDTGRKHGSVVVEVAPPP